eukprot:scaffold123079_cov63-Phaeocystis_antarctica.AAC.2
MRGTGGVRTLPAYHWSTPPTVKGAPTMSPTSTGPSATTACVHLRAEPARVSGGCSAGAGSFGRFVGSCFGGEALRFPEDGSG